MSGLSRRGLFFGAAALLAAPAIVRVASLMPVSVKANVAWDRFEWNTCVLHRKEMTFAEFVRFYNGSPPPSVKPQVVLAHQSIAADFTVAA